MTSHNDDLAYDRAAYGVRLYRAGDARAALDWLRLACDDAPMNGELHAALAVVADAAGEGPIARRALERAIAIEPTASDACARWCALGELYLDAHDDTRASMALLRAAELSPLDPAAGRARALMRDILSRHARSGSSDARRRSVE